MSAYFDASALAKAYVLGEPHRDLVLNLLALPGAATCRLSEVEVASALCRRAREGTLAPSDRDLALDAFRQDLARWIVVETTPNLAAATWPLLARHPLRAGDATQLAAALLLRARIGRAVTFVVFDARLAATARAEGFDVVDG